MSSSAPNPHPLLRFADRPEDGCYSHPLNPNSEMRGVSLSTVVGLQRVGLNLIKLAPGKESACYHTHTIEEEFFYILSGRGIAEIDGEEFEVGPGDFMGFPTPSVGHHLKNPFEEELVYLAGGERGSVEVASFPHHGKRLIRVGREAQMVDESALEPFWKADAGG